MKTIRNLTILTLMVTFPAWAGETAKSKGAADPVEGVWNLEQIVTATTAVEPEGGFIFMGGYYSTTVNFSQEGVQTNISQFGTYSSVEGRLSLAPLVQVSTRANNVIYDPESPFSWEISVIGDEMRGISSRDGVTFVFKRLH